MCHVCQMVKLVREPDNPYDRWAVRVDNILGEKVGHLSRQVAFVVRRLPRNQTTPAGIYLQLAQNHMLDISYAIERAVVP